MRGGAAAGTRVGSWAVARVRLDYIVFEQHFIMS